MSSEIIVPEEKEPETEYTIIGEAEVFSHGGNKNTYYRIKNGNQYKYIWHNSRRLKVEDILKMKGDTDNNFFLCGVSDDPYPLSHYLDKPDRYCRPCLRKRATIDICENLHGKPWDEEAYRYLEAFAPMFLRVKFTNKGSTLEPTYRFGTVHVSLDENSNIVKIQKDVYTGDE